MLFSVHPWKDGISAWCPLNVIKMARDELQAFFKRSNGLLNLICRLRGNALVKLPLSIGSWPQEQEKGLGKTSFIPESNPGSAPCVSSLDTSITSRPGSPKTRVARNRISQLLSSSCSLANFNIRPFP